MLYKFRFRQLFFFILYSAVFITQAEAGGIEKEKNKKNSTAPDTTVIDYDFPQVDVIGRKESLLNRIPGSAGIVSSEQLAAIQPLTGNDIFKRVSGLNVVDEEGAGLRINIGIRGLDPDRSRTILMMEDGIPISLAPYGEPEMYYTPSIDRMKRVEVLKGSGSILFGPQTIGGVINYITEDPPAESKTNLSLKGGENGFFTGRLNYGTTVDNVGLNFGVLHRQADKLGTVNFTVNDLTSKIKFNMGEKSIIGIKLAYYDEISNSTYIGLTQSMFDNSDYYKVIAPNDRLDIKRYSASITYDYIISAEALIRTTIFGYGTTRNWLRQEFSRSSSASNRTGEVFGDTTIQSGAIYMLNKTGNRDRQFEVLGVEPRIFYSYNFGNLDNDLEGGIRFLYEKAYEQRVNGRKADAVSGDLVDDEIRIGNAGSAFFQNRIYLSKYFTVTPGLRLEYFNYKREIYRISNVDTNLSANNNILSLVPGLGINYNFDNKYSLFAGIHRGFAPPRIKDAITSSGEALQLEAELSWNSEAGLRASLTEFLFVELTGYMLDFSNQIIPVSVSSGGLGTGLVNGGRTLHYGLETGVRLDIGKILGTEYGLLISVNASYNKAKYNADRFVTVNEETINIKDNKLPYAPEFLFTGSAEFLLPFGLGLQFSGTFVDKQFTDELNTIDASADGQTGIMPSYFVFDITSRYILTTMSSSLFLSVKNITDERYIASRRPQGIKVGLPRMITAGVEVNF